MFGSHFQNRRQPSLAVVAMNLEREREREGGEEGEREREGGREGERRGNYTSNIFKILYKSLTCSLHQETVKAINSNNTSHMTIT